MKKTTPKKITKPSTNKPDKVSVTVPAPINHLAPIHDLASCIRACEVKLKLLLDTTTAKLEKLIGATRAKITKIEAQQKNHVLLMHLAQELHHAKQGEETKAAVKKSSTSQAAIIKSLEETKTELVAWQTQLKLCKEMKKTSPMAQGANDTTNTRAALKNPTTKKIAAVSSLSSA